ncbi:MAG: hypothetical protein ONB48_03840 [candidate division KSB1 bacterium]|nr:hypothetical protein [candidate division KSB1 bacterium]MDZ7274557.1 hypothetical protein [candidate division KSB1 bacterium]MDZ7284782.1 hypothetical protein [candidate division KSB1 bacterium]MDZ7297798.1 hypothetical protein [candidate division KSB1 bacterium]MDZ7306413.1 hypothetical protein [candidate division KSB1 bacterium]
MKRYAEVLRSYLGRRGELRPADGYFHFTVSQAAAGSAILVEIGADYAEFVMPSGNLLVPLAVLVLELKSAPRPAAEKR